MTVNLDSKGAHPARGHHVQLAYHALPHPFVLIWMSCRRNVLTTIGMSIPANICQILRKDSQNSLHWKRFPRGHMWLGGRVTKIRTIDRPDHVWPEKFWRKLVKLRSESKNNRNGEKRNPKLDNARRQRGIYFSIEITKSTKKFSRIRWKSWKDLWLRPCLANDKRASRKCLWSRKSDPRRTQKHSLVVQFETHDSTRQRVEFSA